MRRRHFLASSLAVSAAAATARADETGAKPERDYYELRLYQLRRGPQVKRMQDFLREAAIPAWNRIGVGPVGVFNVVIGPENPTLYVLLRHRSARSVLTAEDRLMADQEFRKAGADVIDTPSTDPAYVRMESSILVAFKAAPEIEVPQKQPRIFELRTYENHSKKANLTKIRMFETGEIAIFRRAGLQPVFFGETLAGALLPNITYMLTFRDFDARQKAWSAFGQDPEWKKLSSTPGFTDAEIVCNITNCILAPAAFSQV
jgi:NIPSNAP